MITVRHQRVYQGVPAETIATALDTLYQQHEALRPQDVVAAATDPAAPLHPCFEWDDERAGHEHRLQQARTLIRMVRVVSESDGVIEPRRVYVHVDVDAGYQPMTVAVQRVDYREKALAELFSSLNQARQALEEFHRIDEGAQLSDLRPALAQITATVASAMQKTA